MKIVHVVFAHQNSSHEYDYFYANRDVASREIPKVCRELVVGWELDIGDVDNMSDEEVVKHIECDHFHIDRYDVEVVS